MRHGPRVPDGVFVSWVRHHGRSADLAAALGLREAYYPERVVGWPRPLRYLAALLAQLWLLARTRPRVLVVMSPPPIPAVVGALYGALLRRTVVVDAHSGAFTHGAWRVLSRLSLRLLSWCPRAAVVVTNAEMAERAREWTAVPVLELHDLLVPRAWSADGSCDVFVVSSWADDEPLDLLAEAPLEGLRVVVSGRPGDPDLRARLLAAGVEVPGFLPQEEYERRFAGAGVVLALTTREGTMQRGGYEAACTGKALVVSGSAVLRDWFGDAAVYAPHDPDGLAAALREAVSRREGLEQAMRALRDRRLAEQETGLAALRDVLAR